MKVKRNAHAYNTGVEPIIALATPPLMGALALIRLSGDDVFAITEKFFNKKIEVLDTPKIIHGVLSFEGKPIDEVVLFCYPAGKSSTGEETVEISCHGSPLIADEIIQAYLGLGVRMAVNGEFTSRAFYNGKLDIIQAEAINDLIRASTREQKDLAFRSVNGETSKLLTPLLDEIRSLLSIVEVGIDYPEYNEGLDDISAIKDRCLVLRDKVANLIKDGDEGSYIRNGVNVALLGEPNVGKSSILNALLQEEKAIVSPIPGTTRDVVEGDISIKGLPVHIYDTAGIRESEDYIEKLGIDKSRKALDNADLVILVSDENGITGGYQELKKAASDKKIIEVCNKIDLGKHNKSGFCEISAKNGEVKPLIEAIFNALHLNNEIFSKPTLSSKRELSLLRQVKEELNQSLLLCEAQMGLDIIAASLQRVYNLTRVLLGLDPTQDFGEEIFSRFCVGK